MTEQTPNTDAKRDGAWREWTAVAIGLTGLLSVLAVIISLVALSSSSKTPTTTIQQAAAPTQRGRAVPAPAPLDVKMNVKTDTEHGKRGSDGQWHDAILGGNFTAKAGQMVTVTVTNYDYVAPLLHFARARPQRDDPGWRREGTAHDDVHVQGSLDGRLIPVVLRAALRPMGHVA